MNGRRMSAAAARTGGSSLINGILYPRNALDYVTGPPKAWKTDLTWIACLTSKKAETRDIGGNDYHGGDGPVSVTTPRAATTCFTMRWWKPACEDYRRRLNG